MALPLRTAVKLKRGVGTTVRAVLNTALAVRGMLAEDGLFVFEQGRDLRLIDLARDAEARQCVCSQRTFVD